MLLDYTVLHRAFESGDPIHINLQQLLLNQVLQPQSGSRYTCVQESMQDQQSQEMQPLGNAACKKAWAVLHDLISSQAKKPEQWEVWEDAHDENFMLDTELQVLVAIVYVWSLPLHMLYAQYSV